MFRRIEGQAPRRAVSLAIEGSDVQAREGDTLAVALLQAGVDHFRETPVSGAPRAPLCLMGVCFDCLVEVDGVANVQACMVTVRDGMQVRLQHGARHAEAAT
ncbi:MAG: (2Fe-2S)-binding protein [Rubrivivax sp.]|nr:(2Fe-2S)-binding protein [Rubrivivax sp.]MDH5341175.1 (2Fe-2S)-binding protein [Rubrivivax sp.]